MGVSFSSIALAIGYGLYVYHGYTTRVYALLHDLPIIDISEVPPLIEELRGYCNGYLKLGCDELEKWILSNDERKKLIAALVFLPEKPSQVDFLVKRLLRVDPDYKDGVKREESHAILQELVKHLHAVGNDDLAELIGVVPDQQIKKKLSCKALSRRSTPRPSNKTAERGAD